MKDTLKMVLSHFFVICVSVMFFTSISNLVCGNKTLPIEYPFQILINGVLTAPPSLLFYFKKEPTKKQFYTRLIIHFFIIEAIVMTEGVVFRWYGNIAEAVTVAIIVILVYAIVFSYTMFSDKAVARKINDKLKKFQDRENEEE